MKNLITSLSVIVCLSSAPVLAEEPEITNVSVNKLGMFWSVHVTIKHPDFGWDHYADGWEVLDSDGNVLGYRELMHPHVNEQPFTRALNNLVIPDGTREIFIRARCNEDGWVSETFRVALNP